MNEPARCIRCRQPLDERGRCAECEARKVHDDLALEERLRKLREEVFRERSREKPAEPRSPLWRRKKEQLEEARRAAGAVEAASPDAVGGVSSPATPEAPAETDPGRVDPGPVAPEQIETGRAEKGQDETGVPEPTAAEVDGTGRRAWESAARLADTSPRVYRPEDSASGIRARELDVADPRHGSEAVRDLLRHRREGRGKIVGIAGLPRHGKTKLADRLRERYAERPGADLRYDKTERGEVNIYYVPGRHEHHVLVDVAGEDFQALGDYDQDLPALVRRFLWPILQELDGLILLMALPIVWAGWNPDADSDPDRRVEPSERDEIGMRNATRRMVDAHRMLLKYAMVARDLERLSKALPQLGLDPDHPPTRNQVDDAFRTARRLAVPVALGFSKADLYAPVGADGGPGRSGLYTPDLPGGGGRPAPPLHPLFTDPLVLGHLHFPELFDFLQERVRYFKFDFVQALVDRSTCPDPREAAGEATDASRETFLGAEGLLEFVTHHPWRLPGMGTAAAIRLDRRLRPDRWNRSLLRRLFDRQRPGAPR
jgi:hypothetical protein